MPKLTGTFEAAGDESLELAVLPGQSYYIVLTPDPSLTGSIVLLKRVGTAATETVATFTAENTGTEYTNHGTETVYLKLRCITIDEEAPETCDYTLMNLLDSQRMLVDGRAKVGATAGWVVNAGDDIGMMATLPASQTDATCVLRVYNLHIGDRITGFYPVGQVESAGNTASLTVNLRKLTAAAADVTDASVATSGAVEYTADAVLGRITQPVECDATVADGESYYFLVTGTTGASTDIALMGVMVSVQHAVSE